MTVDEVRRRRREIRGMPIRSDSQRAESATQYALLYHSVLRTLLDHDISDDARQLIEAALEAER